MNAALATQLHSAEPPPVPASKAPIGFRVEPSLNTEKKRKALLLEDDAAFKEIMNTFLVENSFDVVAVTNGVEGVHEVLAGDFEVILCDMQMPTLPGDMFYRAVERMRPQLCDRFIFMTGYRGNPKVNEFVSAINGTVLMKPFHMDDLLELTAFIELRALLLAA
jgi:DNA-binding NtrC family response regulator